PTYRPPTRPTLFPYTTLFRSLGGGQGQRHGRGESDQGDVGAVAGHGGLAEFDDVAVRGRRALAGEQALVLEEDHRVVAADGRGQDRKSTRLNSSHVKISYAVF